MPTPSRIKPTKPGRVHAYQGDSDLQKKMEGKSTDFQQKLRKAESTGSGNFNYKGKEIAARKNPGPPVGVKKLTAYTPEEGKITMKKRKTPTGSSSSYQSKSSRPKKRLGKGVAWKREQGSRKNTYGAGRSRAYKGN